MSTRETYLADHPLDPLVRIEEMETSSITGPDVIDLWVGEAALPPDEATRRLSEVLLVAIEGDTGGLAGVFTAGLRSSERLGLTMWYARAFVSSSWRTSNVASHLLDRGRALLEQRFVEGTDRRAPGMWLDVENEGLKRARPEAVWPLGFTFIGENRRGDHVRVLWFEGATI